MPPIRALIATRFFCVVDFTSIAGLGDGLRHHCPSGLLISGTIATDGKTSRAILHGDEGSRRGASDVT